MIKMKKKWIRGGTALALSAVMSLSMAMPVWATSPDNLTNVSNGGDASNNTQTVEIKSNTNGKDDSGNAATLGQDYDHLESEGTTTDDYGNNTVYVTVNIDTEFTVSIPKKIVLGATDGIVRRATVSPTKTIKVSNVNLGDYQRLKISAPEIIEIKDKNNPEEGDSHKRKVKVSSLSISSDDRDIFKQLGETKKVGVITKDTSGSTGQGIHYEGDRTLEFTVAPYGNDIYAGHWVGVLPFTVNVSDEKDGRTIEGQIPKS